MFYFIPFHTQLKVSRSNDPEDAKWDHFTEDTLLHVFHALLHKLHFALVGFGFPRSFGHLSFFIAKTLEIAKNGKSV